MHTLIAQEAQTTPSVPSCPTPTLESFAIPEVYAAAAFFSSSTCKGIFFFSSTFHPPPVFSCWTVRDNKPALCGLPADMILQIGREGGMR